MKISISFIIIGLGIGWLAGLSVSPVVSTIISVLLALVASSIAFLTNVNFKKVDKEQIFDNWHHSIFLMAFLMLGMIVGSLFGIYAREHNILAPSLEELREEEQKALVNDVEYINSLLKKHMKDDDKDKILKEFIKNQVLSLPLKTSVSKLVQSSRPYSRSSLYSGYEMGFCEFLLGQGDRLVSLIEINRDKLEYEKLINLLDKKREEDLSESEILIQIQQDLEKNCP